MQRCRLPGEGGPGAPGGVAVDAALQAAKPRSPHHARPTKSTVRGHCQAIEHPPPPPSPTFRRRIEDLTLRAAGATSLRALLNDVWLLQTRHVRLAGSVPADRAGNTLVAFAGTCAGSDGTQEIGGGVLSTLGGGEGAWGGGGGSAGCCRRQAGGPVGAWSCWVVARALGPVGALQAASKWSCLAACPPATRKQAARRPS